MVGDSLNCGEAEAIYRTMKPQLLQDLNESGSAQSKPPDPGAAGQVTRPRPSVKPRPQAAEPDATVPAKGFAPQPPAFAEPIPPPTPTPTPPQPRRATPQATEPWTPADSTEDEVPAWLAERLALDAEQQQRTERSRLWARRLVSWGAAGVLLALLAGGGLYLYDQSQVEGALVVVANTNPADPPKAAPASAAPRVDTAQASPSLPANVAAPVTPVPAPAAPVSAEGSIAAGNTAVGGSAVAQTDAGAGQPAPESPALVSTTPPASSAAQAGQAGQAEDQPADIAPPRHQRSHVRKRLKAEASARAAKAEPSARQRREETLMQCRAHGYDERQCLRRGCEMTRYGFACKG
jgi:hypothetical protein